MGRFVYWLKSCLIISLCFRLEQRAVREAIARDNQIREIFADLDTNGDSLYVLFILIIYI
jgi:hypothetical protein